ncbi:MAG: TonB-dependent receptor [Flavobacteriaceae bacterium]|nr:TonB-dependent receptor [Flavobacteriaceae bacterium]MDA7848784.1 TonB-dependent receptor [Flavobacteriaceae bacterium]MDG1309091.1 TonB-dependent receptor [Flavobacteriaceae bacterium]
MKSILYLVLLVPFLIFSQSKIEGMIMELDSQNQQIPLLGANVFWFNTSIGTITSDDGTFTLPYKPSYKKLVISFVGFKTDTLTIDSPKMIHHLLQTSDDLGEITIAVRKKSSATSFLSSQNISTISSKELLKAACCNLSESFETNPSIDVNFTDAISGSKQIKMLGLTSPYILIATENIPSIRGASQAYGLSFIPGTWVESIQITKGAGSVVNGFESIAGQINAELVKPTTDNRIFVNAYGSLNGRTELNTHFNTTLSERWSTGLYVHADNRSQKFDRNNDSFLDMPLSKQLNIMNRWQYSNLQKGLISFLNVRYLTDEKQSGQLDFDPETDRLSNTVWGSEIATTRFEISAKFGYVNPEIPYQSLGFQMSYSDHDQTSYFGLNQYDIRHKSVYSNLVYNSIISDSRHKIKTGLNATYDDYNERVDLDLYDRSERSIGGFFEYSFDNLEALNLTAGIRVDHHNLLGTFITPRVHARYTPWEKSALRVSFGRGKRAANIFAENQKLFATSRAINIQSTGGNVYGLDPEVAWNYGVSFLQGFELFGRKADLTLDFYRTDFQNQVVVDYENPYEVIFYNLEGSSFANSFQAEFSLNILERLDFKTAYKFYDVKTQYKSGKLNKPLTSQHRVFANLSFETVKKDKGGVWKFDTTFNWFGKQRFSSTVSSPEAYQLPSYSPTISTLNAQITKVFSDSFELYVGAENITNSTQKNPILSSENPFGSNFDTTFVYGPIFGSTFYTGLRYKLN